MSRIQNLLLLIILGITDAYMISHPNLVGRLGIFVFKYGMIKNFPNALVTVFITLGICYFLSFFFQKNWDKKWTKWASAICIGLSLGILIQVLVKFSGGSYAMTGKAFKYGMILLPALMTFIFSSNWLSKKEKI